MAKILIMEDEPGISFVLQEVLSGNGHEIVAVKDGFSGLQKLEEGSPPDVVLVDYRLPVVNGKEIIKKMAVTAKFRTIPRILMSGSSPTSTDFPPKESYQAFISKPFDIFEMVNLVEDCLKKHPILSK